jgi:hypothetical protein
MADKPAIQTPVIPKKSPNPFLWWTRELVAFVIWLFIFIKILIYDIDVLAISILPRQAETFLKYKIFFILGLIAALWLFLGNRRFIRGVVYVIFYPVVVLLWKIPKMLFKNWVLLLVFSPAIHSMITNLRMSFILSVGALLAGLAIIQSNKPAILIPAMIFLGLYLCRHGVKKIKMAFHPSSVFTNIADAIRKLWAMYEEKIIPDQVKVESKLDPTSDAYRQKTLENLNSLYLINSVLQGVLFKLKKTGIGRKLDIYFISSLLYAALLTVVIFAFEYLGIEKIQPGSFTGIPTIGFWEMLSFSFNTLMTSGLSPILPKSTMAQIVAHCELITALLLLVILVFVILTIFRERFREDAELAIAELTKGAELIEGHILRQYKLTIADTEQRLVEKNRSVVNWLRRFRGLKEMEVVIINDPQPAQQANTAPIEKK